MGKKDMFNDYDTLNINMNEQHTLIEGIQENKDNQAQINIDSILNNLQKSTSFESLPPVQSTFGDTHLKPVTTLGGEFFNPTSTQNDSKVIISGDSRYGLYNPFAGFSLFGESNPSNFKFSNSNTAASTTTQTPKYCISPRREKKFEEVKPKEIISELVSTQKSSVIQKPTLSEQIAVEFAQQEDSDFSEKPYTEVYIKNIGTEIKEWQIKGYFLKYGQINNVRVMYDANTRQSRGFGFINFNSPDSAKLCVREENGKIWMGMKVYLGRALNSEEREFEAKKEFRTRFLGLNVLVKNLDYNFNEQQLIKLFKQFGTIQNAFIGRNKFGKSLGYGCVCFSTEEEAEYAIKEMNDKKIGKFKIEVCLSINKEEREDIKKKKKI